MKKYHADSISQVFVKLQSSETGLSSIEADARLKANGANVLPSAKVKTTRLKIFINQWKSPLILILAFAGFVSLVLAEYTDAIVIFFTVFINVFIGFVQEYKADVALEKLQNFVKYSCLVLRDGKKNVIPVAQLVVGDVILLEAGSKIQADARIFYCNNLQVNEAPLTGESVPVEKNTKKISAETVLANRNNMLYAGTTVVVGNAYGVVTDIGQNTEIGKIATLVKETSQEETPLQNQLKKISRFIGIIVIFVSIFIFSLGFIRNSVGYDLLQIFKTAVAVAVAAIPEGLAISLTVILALGMQHILKRRALVRKLISAETLGSVSVICTDKTGTLTEGRMLLSHLITANNEFDDGEINLIDVLDKNKIDEKSIMQVGILCNDSFLQNPQSQKEDWNFVGDTTDSAFLIAGLSIGLDKTILENKFKRIAEIPFDSRNKFMASLHQDGQKKNSLYIKGSFESIFAKSSFYQTNGKIKKIDKKIKEWFIKQERILAEKGLRVLALATKDMAKEVTEIDDKNLDKLVFLGIVALSDPLRPEAKETILRAKQAGIRTIMITGDNQKTAQFIGHELGIACEKENIMTGEELEKISDIELSKRIDQLYIFARVDPKHKIRIVEVLQRKGEVVAMTGDGVNDAPALKGANIGIALGSGSDVAKDIADLVLTDDNFATIVAAVEEGRHIYKNIKKVILYLLAGSFNEMVLISGSIIAGMPLALLSVQILWINFIAESFPNMALAFDKKIDNVMLEKPKKRSENIIDKEILSMILLISTVSSLILFSLFLYYSKLGYHIDYVRTVVFAGLGVYSLIYIYSIRSLKKPLWKINFFDNNYLTSAIVLGIFLLLMAVYFLPLQILLQTVSLEAKTWFILIIFGLLNVLIIELFKGLFLFDRREKQV
ncbi:MAG: HAD-IC family P-type ATPase [Patescibacteria group bacterium]|nr:HAD-IC family P-type ATPase [Patescibacteria group bacterium]